MHLEYNSQFSQEAEMTRIRLSYAGYADHLAGQFGGPSLAHPVPLMEGVLGFFDRREPRLRSFHIEHFQSFNDWKCLRELLGEEVTNEIYGLYQEVSQQERPALSGLTEDELSRTMKESLVYKELDIGWSDDSEVAQRLRRIVDRWETGS